MERLSDSKSSVVCIALALVLTACGGGGTSSVSSPPPPPPAVVTVSVSPASATLLTGATQPFTATVTGTANTAVTWSVNDLVGGDATVGTISSSGLYVAPPVPTIPNTVTVKATSGADPTKTDTAAVTINNPQPIATSISPTAVDAGSGDSMLTVNGSGFSPQSLVQMAGTNLGTTFHNSGQLAAQIPAAMLTTAGTFIVTVVTPAPGGGTTGALNLAVKLVVGVSPAVATVMTGQQEQFAATVSGSPDSSVIWLVNDVAGGDSALGTITAAGLYTAPTVPPMPNPVTIKARSVADPARTGTASASVVNPQPALSAISPASVAAGSGDATLLVSGSGFSPLSTVWLGNTSLATSFQSTSQLTAIVAAAQLASPGTPPVTVVNPSPGGGTSNALGFPVLAQVSVTPSSQVLMVGQPLQFAATVTGVANQSVEWFANDQAGGNAAVGTITTAGLYTAPAIPPSSGNVVIIKAVSVAAPPSTGSAAVTVMNPSPVLNSISPATVDAGSPVATLTVTGSNFAAQSVVRLGNTDLTTLFQGSTQLSAQVPPSMLTIAQSLPLIVVTPAPGGGSSGALNFAVNLVVTISPVTATVFSGQTRLFTATVVGSSGTGVTWSVNDIAGGSSAVGTISGTGLYAAPAVPPNPNTLTITATSVADPSHRASAQVDVVNPLPTLSQVTPSSVFLGSADTTLSLTGTGFTPQSVVWLNSVALTTTFQNSAQLTAVAPASQLATFANLPLVVVTPAPGGGTSNSLSFAVVSRVTVTPSAPALLVNQTRQFTATVAGLSNQSVHWRVNDVPGGNAIVGTMTTTGLYLAPGSVPNPATVTVKAISDADPTQFGTAAATISLPTSDNYPRGDATSVLRSPPPLLQIGTQGAMVAVLDWTAKDPSANEEDVLALCHALNPWAIRHVHTTDVAAASAYPVVVVAGVMEALNTPDRAALTNYVSNGGTLLLWRPADSGLLANLGIVSSNSISGTTTRPLTFDVLTADPALHYVDDDVEINWQMTYPGSGHTRGYTAGSALPLAHWNTGEAAVLRSNVGSGRAYVFGWRLRYVVAEGERLVIPGPEPKWTNLPILDSDVAKLLVRAVYEDVAGAAAQVRQFAPNGKPAGLIITHDVDAPSSYNRVPEFVQEETILGVKATFNFTTDPYDAGWTGLLYTLSSRQNIQLAVDSGFDVESHSFGHFPDFSDAPLGSGNENASNYFPRYSGTLQQTFGMSSIGELGVSRWLLENDFGIVVPGFRSGELDVSPDFLPALQLTGYVRDSTYAAGVSRGALPFVLFSTASSSVTTYPVMEYPLAASDEGLSDANLQDFLDAWERVIRDNYKNNAPTVLLIHPVRTGPRLEAIGQLLQRVADLDLWIGDWKTFAEFWEAQGVTCDRWP